MQPPGERAFYIHAGTHKTGTTSIQVFLADNAELLRAAGILVPQAGRPVSKWGTARCGHHNAAWGLSGISIFDERDGSFEAIVAEAERSGASSVVVSSEEFEYLHARPDVLAAMAGRIRDAGFVPYALLWVRTQGEYLQSTYAEGAKSGYVPGMNYERLVREVLETGVYIPDPKVVVRFDYAALAEGFASVFGRERTIVRAYNPGAPDAIVREFLSIVAAAGGLAGTFRLSPPENVSPALWPVLAAMHQALARTDPSLAPPREIATALGAVNLEFAQHKLDVLVAAEAAVFNDRFAASNAALERDYGAKVPPAKAAFRDANDPAELRARLQRELLFAALRAWKILEPATP